MKERVIYYWSDKCDRKATAEAAVQEVREVYANVKAKKSESRYKNRFLERWTVAEILGGKSEEYD